ncbi:histidine ammonia-lyase [candidate division WOR-3 bacterium]|uniref:Histidine ammonia-lyase n=1 Tax=candidate division WOR-3 bacterium TaxID=2052148 RepID=A0A660SIZ8_UNCW3|nr:MAG: histidine ammonia-lyase [candidate division WOR-3 bacterium]
MVRLGRTLTIEDVVRVARGEAVSFGRGTLERLDQIYQEVTRLASGPDPIYGVNTGFGSLARIRIPEKKIATLQQNLIESHCAGVGRPLSTEIVRAAMVIRINTLLRGYSGVRSVVVKLLAGMLNRKIHPIVPAQGSVGASGDLAPTAAIGAVMIGKGKAEYQGRIYPGRIALKKAGLRPIRLGPKEGLALLNGTQFMAALGTIGLARLENLLRHSDLAGAISIDGLRGTDRCFDPKLTGLRPYPGMIQVARNLRQILKGSQILRSHRRCGKVQDPYSLRCIPQVHGSVREAYRFAKGIFEREINSVTDNPVLIPEKGFLSGGHFHGQPLAYTLDFLTIGVSHLASISERRIARLLDHNLSGLPPNLTENPGLNSGLMILQLTAAALTAENRTLSHPASVESIPTSANQEDFVSMGMNSGLKFLDALINLRRILAIEIICGLQAIEFLRPLTSSPVIERVRRRVRRKVPFIRKDRELTSYVESLATVIESGQLLKGLPIK